MAGDGEFKESTRLTHLMMAIVAFLAVALLPIVLRVFQVFFGN